MDRRIPIPQPTRGLNTDAPFGDQPQGTLKDGSKNVRLVDSKTGRSRLSQRSGTTKYNLNALNGSNKVADLCHVVYDNKRITYSTLASGSHTVEWDTPTPSGNQCRNIVTDDASNVYALNGLNGIVKYNPEETERFKIAPPVEDPSHALVALFVDDLYCIYTGVGSGGDQRTAKAWKYAQGPDPDEFFLAWEITPGGYVEDIVVVDDQAYLAVNFTDEARSEIQIYDTLDGPPRLIKTIDAPHPINGMDVNSSGEPFTAHPFNPDALTIRPSNPKAPDFSNVVEDWTPKDLTNADQRIYRWHDAEKITDKDTGDPILRWDDLSGNDRHLYANFGTALPPTYSSTGIAGKPTVRFEVPDYTQAISSTSQQGLETLRNPGIALNYRDQQQTFVPAHTGAAFTVYMVVRCVADGTNIHTIWYQADDTTSYRGIFANRDEGDNAGSNSSGAISVYDDADAGDPGGGTNGHPLSSTFTADSTDTVLITYQCDGGVNGGTSGTGATRSVLRINGEPIDRWESEPCTTSGASFLGTCGTPGSPPFSTWEGFTGNIAEIIVLQRDDVTDSTQPTVQTEDRLPDAGAGDQTENEMTEIEGYLMHKWGISSQAPADGDTYPHPYGPDSLGFSGPPTDGSDGVYGATLRGGAQLIKWSPSGDITWMVETQRDRIGGIGVDVKLGRGDETNVYSLGDYSMNIAPANSVNIRRIIDNGATATFKTGSDYWTAVAGGTTLNDQHIKIDTDKFDNVYVPLSESSQSNSLAVYDKDGSSNAGVQVALVDLSTDQRGRCVAVDRSVPEYDDDAVTVGEFFYIGSENNGNNTENTVHKIGLVGKAGSTGSHRSSTLLGVSGGNIYKIPSSGTPSIPTGGTAAISTNSNYVESIALRGVAYFVDGESYKKYVGKDDEVVDWKSTSSGKIPPRCRLITSWRGRIVLAGDPDNQSLWHMSAKGDADDWDRNPPVPLATQAISANSNTQTAGLMPDIINTMIPYDDDTLIFGGDHTIYRLTGDPMAGGELDLVSDITGMAFGRSWTKDPDGVIYFVGSRGGLYRMAPGGKPVRISRDTIERKLQDSFDFSTHHVRLIYNWRDEGQHVFQFPFGTVTQEEHFFWDSKHEAPLEDEFALTSAGAMDNQPTAAVILDGDEPGDRVMLLGFNDGYVRKWDKDARDDDDVRVVSKAIIGPIADSRSPGETKFSRLELVLADDQEGLTYKLFSSHEADDMGVAVYTEVIGPGRNAYSNGRMRGSYCWLSLENAAPGEKWSMESASIRVVPAGRKRVRSG